MSSIEELSWKAYLLEKPSVGNPVHQKTSPPQGVQEVRHVVIDRKASFKSHIFYFLALSGEEFGVKLKVSSPTSCFSLPRCNTGLVPLVTLLTKYSLVPSITFAPALSVATGSRLLSGPCQPPCSQTQQAHLLVGWVLQALRSLCKALPGSPRPSGT